jgi:hypothetical protein
MRKLGKKSVPVLLCPPQIPHGLTRARTRGRERSAPNRLSHGTAFGEDCIRNTIVLPNLGMQA